MFRSWSDILERRISIFRFLRREGKTSYKSITKEFGISEPTAVRDVEFVSNYIACVYSQIGRAGYISLLEPDSPDFYLKVSGEDAKRVMSLRTAVDRLDYHSIEDNRDDYLDTLDELIHLCVRPFMLNE